jgi:hypothetical protein
MFYRGKIMWWAIKHIVLWGVFSMLVLLPITAIMELFSINVSDDWMDITFGFGLIVGGFAYLYALRKYRQKIEQQQIIQFAKKEIEKTQVNQAVENHLRNLDNKDVTLSDTLESLANKEPINLSGVTEKDVTDNSTIFCTNCGRKSAPTDKFCKGCGESLISQ